MSCWLWFPYSLYHRGKACFASVKDIKGCLSRSMATNTSNLPAGGAANLGVRSACCALKCTASREHPWLGMPCCERDLFTEFFEWQPVMCRFHTITLHHVERTVQGNMVQSVMSRVSVPARKERNGDKIFSFGFFVIFWRCLFRIHLAHVCNTNCMSRDTSRSEKLFRS